MSNTVFQIRRNSVSGVRPTTASIQSGELAINLTDGIAFSTNGSVVFELGGNTTNQKVTNSLSVASVFTVNNSQVTTTNPILINNNVQLRFQTVNTSSFAGFAAQSDDNFVFYTTNTSGALKAVWNAYSNTNSPNQNSAFRINVPLDISTQALYSNGSTGTSGQVLTSTGTGTYWSTVSGGVNTAAQYTWTNTHTFTANVSFTGNNISLVTNTGSIFFNGSSDSNWRIGRSTGGTTKFYYSNNTLDLIGGGSNLEGIAFGQPGANSYLETGNAGTFTRNPIYVGNTSVNVSIYSTSIVVGNSTINVTANSSYLSVANGIFLSPQTTVGANTSEGSVFYDVTNHALNVYGDDASTPIELGQIGRAHV